MEKAYITRFVLDDQKPEKFHIHQRTTATIDARGYVNSGIRSIEGWDVVIHIGVGSGLLVLTERAISGPQRVERVTDESPRFFCIFGNI